MSTPLPPALLARRDTQMDEREVQMQMQMHHGVQSAQDDGEDPPMFGDDNEPLPPERHRAAAHRPQHQQRQSQYDDGSMVQSTPIPRGLRAESSSSESAEGGGRATASLVISLLALAAAGVAIYGHYRALPRLQGGNKFSYSSSAPGPSHISAVMRT